MVVSEKLDALRRLTEDRSLKAIMERDFSRSNFAERRSMIERIRVALTRDFPNEAL